MLHVPVTNPVRKRQKTLRFLQAREIPVPGRTFEFPDGEQKRSADLVVVEVAEEGSSTPYRYVTVTDAGLPDKAFVTIYDGERKTAPKFKRGVTKTSAEARRKKNKPTHTASPFLVTATCTRCPASHRVIGHLSVLSTRVFLGASLTRAATSQGLAIGKRLTALSNG